MLLLVEAALAFAQSFEKFAFAIGAMVFGDCLLAQELKPADFGLEFVVEAIEVVAENGSELEFCGGASGGKSFGVGPGGIGEEKFELRQCFVGTGNLKIGILQLEGALALDALAEAE